jgi:hypothetical protein
MQTRTNLKAFTTTFRWVVAISNLTTLLIMLFKVFPKIFIPKATFKQLPTSKTPVTYHILPLRVGVNENQGRKNPRLEFQPTKTAKQGATLFNFPIHSKGELADSKCSATPHICKQKWLKTTHKNPLPSSRRAYYSFWL